MRARCCPYRSSPAACARIAVRNLQLRPLAPDFVQPLPASAHPTRETVSALDCRVRNISLLVASLPALWGATRSRGMLPRWLRPPRALTRLHRAHQATEVFVTGDFDAWKQTVKLEKHDGVFQKTVDLPKAKHQYKVSSPTPARLLGSMRRTVYSRPN